MKKNKLERLLSSAKNESAPQAGPGFASRVMRAVRQEHSVRPVSLLDELNGLFPRLAPASVLAVILFVAADFVLANSSATDLAAGVSSISEEWLFPTKGF